MFKRLSALLLLVIMLSAGITERAVSKSYTIPEIRVEVDIRPDGTIQITEHRTYVFDGSFSWADYRLPLVGYSSIENIRISEGDTAFINENSEQPGTFMVQRSEGQIRMQWFYEAEDESRTFTVSYILEGAVIIGPEWSEFFWNYINAGREKETNTLSVSLQLPQKIDTDSLHVWKRGPQDKINMTLHQGGYRVEATNIDENEFVKIRSIFPRNIFESDRVTTTDPDFSLQAAQKDEEVYRREKQAAEEREEKNAAYGEQLMVITGLLSIAFFLFFYRKYGKRHSTGRLSSTETIMIPGRLKPAVAGWLLNKRQVSSSQLMATLLDLARRNYFVIKEDKPKEKFLGGEESQFKIENTSSQTAGDLTEWESLVLEFVNHQIEEGNNNIKELFSGSTIKATRWFSKWKEQLKKDCEARGWYDMASYKGLYANLVVQFILLVPAILATVWAGPIGIIALIITGIFLAASFGIIRRTEEGEVAYKRWDAYRKGLKNAKEHSIGSDFLDKHFIYAIAFGLSKDHIETVFKQCESDDIVFAWFIFYASGTHSPAQVASSFSTLAASGTASFPGTAAGGSASTGASAGAAGGGAAGGAG